MKIRDSWAVWRGKVNTAIGGLEKIFAKDIVYENEETHLETDNVQGAIDILDGEINTLNESYNNLATVATTGDYDDLENKPTIPTVNDATLDIKVNNTSVGTFTANASENEEIDITIPTKVSELDNDSGFTSNDGTVTSVEAGTGLNGGTISTSGTMSVKYGTTGGTACEGNDSRLSDSRTPTSHATTATTYGGATSANYGHSKLSDTYNSLVGNADQSIGASQKAVNDVYKLIPKHSTITKYFSATSLNQLQEVTVDTGITSDKYMIGILYCAYGLLPTNIYIQNGKWYINFRNIYGFTINLATTDYCIIQYLYD